MAAIGILGGMGPQASAHLLNLLVRDAPKCMSIKDDSDFPEIILISVPVPNFIANTHNLDQAKQILIERTKQLERAGSIINGIACNTAHLMLPDLQASTSVPFVSIPQLVAAKLDTMNVHRVGLLATPNTLKSRLYDDILDTKFELIRPDQLEAEQIEWLILKQLQGQITDHNRSELQKLTDQFILRRDLDAVILGCTELPLILAKNNDERLIDTLAILSHGLLEKFNAISVN